MAERTWETSKVCYCEHIKEEVALEAEVLYPMDELEAMEFLLDKVKATKNNAEFFDSMKR